MKIYCMGLLALMSLCLSANDWPHYRGPNRDGSIDVGRLKADRTFGFELDWKRELGSGYSAISIAGKTGVTMYTDGTSGLLVAFDIESGRDIWKLKMGPMYEGHSGSNDGPTGTPTIYRGIVYAIGPHGDLVAARLTDGEELWRRKMGESLPARVPHYGFNTVPTAVGNTLIVMTGQKEEARALTGLDLNTGAEKWHAGDDTTTYQSPFIWKHDGKDLILANTDLYLMALDPDNGEVLWQDEHGVKDNENYGMPVFTGENRIMLHNRLGAAGFDLVWEGGKAKLKELWRSNVYQRTYAIPVYYEGNLFGFRNQFLTCVDPQSGEVKWRSRPPGGRGLIRIDDHLVIIGNEGQLVAVAANGEGYAEKARIDLFEQPSYTPATYVDGYLYLRNLEELARVKVTDKVTVVDDGDGPKLEGIMGQFVRKLRSASDKSAAIEAFLKQHTFPIVEKNGLVHYAFRGEVEDIAVARGFEDEKPLHRVAGTDFYFLTEQLEPDSFWEYNFSVFGESRTDALNPHTVGKPPRIRNELRMSEWKAPDFLGEPSGPRGSVSSFTLDSAAIGEEREVQVYLPAGYEEGDKRYPLLVVNNGGDALSIGKLDVALDNLAGNRVEPMIVAFVQLTRAERDGEPAQKYARFVAKELTAEMDKRYRTDGERRCIWGAGPNGMSAAYIALSHPDSFDHLATHSFLVTKQVRPEMEQLLASSNGKLKVFMGLSKNDYEFPGFNAVEDGPAMAVKLKAKGHQVKTHITGGAASWGSWRSQFDAMLQWFAPGTAKGDH